MVKVLYPWNREWWDSDALTLEELVELHNQRIVNSLERNISSFSEDVDEYDHLFDAPKRHKRKRSKAFC